MQPIPSKHWKLNRLPTALDKFLEMQNFFARSHIKQQVLEIPLFYIQVCRVGNLQQSLLQFALRFDPVQGFQKI